MNKQEILFKLSDTADRLESAGLLREAIVLTNVMKRMAQDNDEQDDTSLAELKIQEIKNLLIENKFEEAESLTTDIYRQIKDPKNKEAFLSQANQIKYIYRNKQKNNTAFTNEQINNLITKYKINSAKTLPEFKQLWTNMINDLKTKKMLTIERQNILRQTYFNIAAKFGVSRFLENSTGNYKKDIVNYKSLVVNGLFNEAEKFLNEAKEKYKGTHLKEFELQAKSIHDLHGNLQPDEHAGGYLNAIDDRKLNYSIRFYGVDKAQNQQQLDTAWGNLIKYYQTYKFPEDLKNPKSPYMYDYPKVKNQLDNFKKRLDIKFQSIRYD